MLEILDLNSSKISQEGEIFFNAISDKDDILQMYLKDVGRTRLLKRHEEINLGYKIKNAEKKEAIIAKKKLVQANLRLVVSIAKKYIGHGVMFMDLVQDGSLGLIRAAERFDYSKGFKFSTYATWWIKQTIVRSIANSSKSIRVPVHMLDKIRNYKKTVIELSTKFGIEPTDEQVAQKMNLTSRKLNNIKRAIMQDPLSLDNSVAEDLTLQDYISDEVHISPENEVDESILKNNIDKILEILTQREKEIIINRYGLNGQNPLTLQELGTKMGFSKERIRQIENGAIIKLKNCENIDELKEFLN